MIPACSCGPLRSRGLREPSRKKGRVMIGSLIVWLALSASTETPHTQTCVVSIVAGDHNSSVAVVECPSGENSPQDRAEAVLSRIDLPSAAANSSSPLDWIFIFDSEAGEWRWPPLRLFAFPASPPSASLRPGVSANCFVVGSPGEDGRVASPVADCILSGGSRRLREDYRQAVLGGVSRLRAAPGSDGQCVTISFSYRLGSTDPDGWPDADALCASSR